MNGESRVSPMAIELDTSAFPLTTNDGLAPVDEQRGVMVKPLDQEEGFRRLAKRFAPSSSESSEETRRRLATEADVVDAARRSQAEIRRHVDSYLKEHFETIAADVARVVVDQVHDRLLRGAAAMQEAQAIALDRVAADMRAQLRAFIRNAWASPKAAPTAQRARPKAKRARAQKKR